MEPKFIQFPENYPEEYITGKVTFFGREFVVTPDVLIPRLETEGLVRRARELLKKEKYDTVIDLGCGSGIIGNSVADLVDTVVFLDISDQALEVAERNFRTHFPGKRAQFVVSNLLEDFKPTRRTLLLANLPYIRGEDWEHMSPDTRHEPELALFGGDETGFELYEKLFAQLCTMHYALCTVIIEFGFDQREIAEEVIQKYGWEYEFFADYAGVERFAEIHLPEKNFSI